MTRKSKKPTPGHKCKGAQLWVSVSCECGWTSGHWSGQGGRSSAYGEWQLHIEQHKREQAA